MAGAIVGINIALEGETASEGTPSSQVDTGMVRGGTWLMATSGGKSLREERAPDAECQPVESQEGLRGTRPPGAGGGNKRREIAVHVLGQR